MTAPATLGDGLPAWAIERKGAAADWLRYDLKTLLARYRRPGKAARSRRRIIRTRIKRHC